MGDVSVEAPSSAVWTVVRLQDVADLRGGYAFKSGDYRDEGVFILRTLNIGGDGSITRENAVFIDDAREQEFEQFKLEEWDTLFVMVGATLGKCGLVRGTDLPALLNQNMWRIRANHKVMEPRFLYYLFSFESQRLLSYASGAARDFVRRDDYRNLSLTVPPLLEQQKIAGVLGALDDKIESNHRINRQLKELSELRLRQAVGSPVGELISSDESIRCVQVDGSEIAIVKPGLGASGIGEEYEYLATAVVFDNSYERGEFGTLASLPSRANMQPGDDRVWFARMKSTEKNLWTPSEFNQKWSCMILSTGFLGMQSADIRLAPLLMTAVRCQEFGEIKDQLCNGTTMQSLNNDAARSMWFRVPANEFKLAELSSEIRSNLLFEARLNDESEILKSVRDALIPELLSGRLHVRDAEKIVERLS